MNILNKKSGILGVSGFSSDLRDIEEGVEEETSVLSLALEVFANRIHKYIGSYASRMNGVDAIVFTAGIGENSRSSVKKSLRLEFMGVYWDPARNTTRGEEAFLTTLIHRLKS